MIKKNILIIRYEDLITNDNILSKIENFLNVKKRKKKVNFFQPSESDKIHKNLKKKIIKQNKYKYKNNLNFIEKNILNLFCGYMLYKFNYEKKNYFFILTGFVFYLVTKIILYYKKLLIK